MQDVLEVIEAILYASHNETDAVPFCKTSKHGGGMVSRRFPDFNGQAGPASLFFLISLME